jgi:hypothetical protein
MITESTTKTPKKRGPKPRKLAAAPDSPPAPEPFDVDRERERLQTFTRQTSDVLERTLSGLIAGTEPMSGALLTSIVSSIKQVSGLLDELEKAQRERERVRRAEEMLRSEPLPFSKRSASVPADFQFPSFPPRTAAGIELPFPVRPSEAPEPRFEESITGPLMNAQLEGAE